MCELRSPSKDWKINVTYKTDVNCIIHVWTKVLYETPSYLIFWNFQRRTFYIETVLKMLSFTLQYYAAVLRCSITLQYYIHKRVCIQHTDHNLFLLWNKRRLLLYISVSYRHTLYKLLWFVAHRILNFVFHVSSVNHCIVHSTICIVAINGDV